VLNTWSCKRKLNNEKSKYAGLGQQNGFDPTFLYVKGTAKPNTTCC
jgi:hypothetical protein